MENINIINGNYEYLCKYIGNAVGFEYAVTRPVIIDIPARDGALYISNMFGARPLAWNGLIRENIMEERRSLIRACDVGSLKTIKFSTCDGLNLQAEVDIVSLTAPYKMGQTIYHIEAMAPDYRFYSQELITAFTTITEFSGGTPIPAAIPAPIGGGSSVDFVVNNAGNIETNPIFTIRGSGTNFVVQNLTTGELFKMNLSLLNNETVVIDTRLRTAFKGSQNVFGSFLGNWINLAPGNNRLTFSAGSGTNENTRLSVAYRNAYLGI